MGVARYRCPNGHVTQTTGELKHCPECGAPVEKLVRLGGIPSADTTRLIED